MKASYSNTVSQQPSLSASDYPLLGEEVIARCKFFENTVEHQVLAEGTRIQKKIKEVVESTSSNQIHALRAEFIRLISHEALTETLLANLMSPLLFKLLEIDEEVIQKSDELRALHIKHRVCFHSILKFQQRDTQDQ